jgi:hypothetical protein
MLNIVLTAICESLTPWTVLGQVRKRGLGRIEIRVTRIDGRDTLPRIWPWHSGIKAERWAPAPEETPWAVGFWFIPQGFSAQGSTSVDRRLFPRRQWRLVGTTCFQGTRFDSSEKRVRAEARACFSLPTCAEEAA